MAIDLETIQNLPLQKKILLLIGVIIILIALLTYLVTIPTHEKYKGLKNQEEKLKVELTELKKVTSVLPKFRKEYQELEQKFTAALKELPEKREIPSLLMNISQLAQESGLQITLFQPQKENIIDFYEEIPVKLKLYGGFHDLAIFFDKLANLSRIVNIKDISIGEATIDKDKVKLHTSCTAITFRFVEEKVEATKGKKPKRKKVVKEEEKI